MSFQKDFDELLNDILTDYKNQFPEADTSQGSLIFIKAACLASATWGLYQHQEWISRQIFPDVAATKNLEHHAWIRGVERKAGESDAELLDRLLTYIRRAPAGGNKYDYERWAMEVTNVAAAYCFPLAQGLGTVDVIVVADEENTGSEIPSSYADIAGTNDSVSEGKLADSAATFQTAGVAIGDVAKNDNDGTQTTVTAVDGETQLTLASDIFTAAAKDYTIVSLTRQVQEYIDDVRPVTAHTLIVLPSTILPQDVTMTVSGTGISVSKIQADIEAYMDSLEPGAALYVTQLISIAIQAGATNVSVTTPAADVMPAAYEIIRPGAIDVS